ncbi:MAG: TonB-dependent receptor, partial [Gammaproteobacteria bacterium]
MSTEALLRQAVRGALAVGAAGSMVGAGVALAQTAPPAGTAAGTTKLSNITVTGSHIPQTAIANAQPVINISRQQIETSGYTTVGNLLQGLSAAGPALNQAYNNGGTGQVFFDLHNLGSQRVLVLVNGQRWLPTLGGSVDISTIPTAIVDHIEVLMDGASAIYGSEAMAGVINIVTIKNYNGAQASAYMGMYDGHGDGGGWDGKTQNYSFTVGTAGDRSAVLLSAGYRNNGPVWAGQRTISKEPYIGTGTAFGSSGTPDGRFVFYDPNWASRGNTNGACGSSAAFGYPGCDFTGPINSTNPFGSAPFTQHFNYAPQNYLYTPQETWYAYTQGHYDLTDNVTFNFTADYDRRNSSQVLAPNPWFFGLAGSEFVNGHAIGVAANNPYNPFGVDLVPGFPSYGNGQYFCQNYGSPTCSTNYETLFFYGRRPNEVGNRVFNQNSQTFYFNGGFKGYWQMFGNQWTWNANYIYGQTLVTNLTTGLASTARIASALGAGCTNDPSCVPLNIFGGLGTITPDQANYILFNAHSVDQQVLRDYNANIGGSFFNSWYAGPWGVAAGYEYQEFDGFFQPDALVAAGNTVGNATKPTSGRQATNAEYAELSIPLASDLPFAKALGIDLANRWSQFKFDGIGSKFVNGAIVNYPANGRAHASTGRVTLKWQPIQQLLFRATWAAGFRIPSISDLFGGASDNFPGLSDPCAGANPAQYCPGPHAQPNAQIHTTIGGNPDLQPEKSISRSLGFVWSPSFAEGLDISADYYKIEVVNQITRKGGQY